MSKVQGGMKCVKYLLFVFNFIFWVSEALCMETTLLLFLNIALCVFVCSRVIFYFL